MAKEIEDAEAGKGVEQRTGLEWNNGLFGAIESSDDIDAILVEGGTHVDSPEVRQEKRNALHDFLLKGCRGGPCYPDGAPPPAHNWPRAMTRLAP